MQINVRAVLRALSAAALFILASCSVPIAPVLEMPQVYEHTDNGEHKAVDEEALFAFEQAARKRFLEVNAPDELVLLGYSSPSILYGEPSQVTYMAELRLCEIKGPLGFVESISDFGKKKARRDLNAKEVGEIRSFLKENNCDHLPRLDADRMVNGRVLRALSGRIYIYLHLTRDAGYRVWIANPPTEEDDTYPKDYFARQHTKLVRFFERLAPFDRPW